MLLKVDKIVKLGGMQISGQVRSIAIEETASIDDIKDKDGNVKKNQPTGYEPAKVTIEVTLESTKSKSASQMLKDMQRIFKAYRQKKSKLLRIVNSDCAARGISKVFFERLSSSKNVSESSISATLELRAPSIAGIKVVKKKKKKAASKKGKKKKTTKSIKKTAAKSPAKDTRNTAAGKKKAKKLVKK